MRTRFIEVPGDVTYVPISERLWPCRVQLTRSCSGPLSAEVPEAQDNTSQSPSFYVDIANIGGLEIRKLHRGTCEARLADAMRSGRVPRNRIREVQHRYQVLNDFCNRR